MHFVSSWDDGHPLDERVAELHADRGLKATFFVPLRNREGRSVMHPSTVRSLDRAGFEIGIGATTNDPRLLLFFSFDSASASVAASSISFCASCCS